MSHFWWTRVDARIYNIWTCFHRNHSHEHLLLIIRAFRVWNDSLFEHLVLAKKKFFAIMRHVPNFQIDTLWWLSKRNYNSKAAVSLVQDTSEGNWQEKREKLEGNMRSCIMCLWFRPWLTPSKKYRQELVRSFLVARNFVHCEWISGFSRKQTLKTILSKICLNYSIL